MDIDDDDKVIDFSKHKQFKVNTVKSLGFDDLTAGDESGLWASEIKAHIDSQNLKGLFFTEDWVFIILDLISDYVSRSPMKILKTSTNQDGKKVDEIIDSHPVLTILDEPNEFQEYSQFIYNYCVELDLMGNALVFYASSTKNLHIIPAETVTLDFDKTGNISGYVVTGDMNNPFKQQSSGQMFFKKKQVWHQRRPNPKTPLWGLSPFIPNTKSILFNRYSQDWLNSFYLKGATPTVALSMDKAVDEKSALRFLRSFEMAHTGRRNQRRPLVLPKGVSIETLSIPIAEQNLPELVRMNREVILNILRVPKHAVSLAETGSLGSEEFKQALRFFYESAIIPKQKKIEGHLTRKFKGEGLLEEDERLIFDNSDVEVLRDDMLKKAELATSLLQIWTPNEIRAELWDKEPILNGDTIRDSRPQLPQFQQSLESRQPHEELAQEPSGEVEEQEEVIIEESKAIIIEDNYKIIDEDDEDDLVMQPKEYRETVLKTIIDKYSEHLAFRAKQNLEIIKTVDEKIKEFWTEIFKEWSLRAVEVAEKELGKAPARQKANADEIPTKIPSKRRLKKLLENALEESSEEYLNFFIDSFDQVVSDSYDVQTSVVTDGDNLAAIEALKAKNAKGRRVLLEARGISSFSQISATQTEAIMKVIEQGVKDKIPLRDIGTKISERFTNITQGKAEMIARTEALTAVSIGKQAAMKDALKIIPDMVKVWINLGDLRVRGRPDGLYPDAQYDHWDLQGETKEINEPFSNGLDYPRDVKGAPGNTIGCRCDFLMVPREDLESLDV